MSDARRHLVADRAYLAQAVSARTGLPQAEAEKRVNDVITEAKTYRGGGAQIRTRCPAVAHAVAVSRCFLRKPCRDRRRSIAGRPLERRDVARRIQNITKEAIMGIILLWLLGIPIPLLLLLILLAR